MQTRWELLRFLKFMELREQRRQEARGEDQTIKQQHGEALRALSTKRAT